MKPKFKRSVPFSPRIVEFEHVAPAVELLVDDRSHPARVAVKGRALQQLRTDGRVLAHSTAGGRRGHAGAVLFCNRLRDRVGDSDYCVATPGVVFGPLNSSLASVFCGLRPWMPVSLLVAIYMLAIGLGVSLA